MGDAFQPPPAAVDAAGCLSVGRWATGDPTDTIVTAFSGYRVRVGQGLGIIRPSRI